MQPSALVPAHRARAELTAACVCALGGQSFSSDIHRPREFGALAPGATPSPPSAEFAYGHCTLGGQSFSSDIHRPREFGALAPGATPHRRALSSLTAIAP